MAKRKGGLGRGLGNLMNDPTVEEKVMEKVTVQRIPVEQIERNRYQPRTQFDETQLQELADSIRVHDIIQPLTVRRLEANKYELIAGERRLKASKIAGLERVPVYVREADDEALLEMALIENIQRVDLDPIEIALSYQRMISELNLKQEDLGDKVGKKRATVTNYLRLLRLHEDVQDALRKGRLSMGHARELVGLEKEVVELMVELIDDRGLSVRQTERFARQIKPLPEDQQLHWLQLTQKKNLSPDALAKAIEQAKAPQPTPQPGELDRDTAQLHHFSQKLREKFGTKVALTQNRPDGPGEMRVSFSDSEELERILDVLGLL